MLAGMWGCLLGARLKSKNGLSEDSGVGSDSPHQNAGRTNRRLFVLAVLLGLGCWAFCPAQILAEIIYLKSGQKIVGEILRENSQQIFISHEGGEVAIPRSIVDHIERSPTPPAQPAMEEEQEDIPRSVHQPDEPFPLHLLTVKGNVHAT